MPTRPQARCPDCKRLHPGTGRCPSCRRTADRARGTTTQRGYGHQHQRTREDWRPDVERGVVDCAAPICLEPTRRILPGQAWDLDHTEDRRRYRGPAHERCNRSTNGGQLR
jgi:hypothetical protein